MTLGQDIPPGKAALNSVMKPAKPAPEERPAPRRFVPRQPRYRLADIVLAASTRQSFGNLLSRIRNHELLYEHWDLAAIDPMGCHRIVSFYGPPGTGKTMCAEALAAELGTGIIEINYAEIESKFVGETPKNIVEAFNTAKETNSVIFFDEADSILGRRMTDVTQAADQAVNVSRAVMLKQLDEFPGVVAFATNLAKNYDSAFVRRILFHLHVDLPDLAAREELWKRMLRPKVPGIATVSPSVLAEASDGLSGGDLRNATIIALSALAARSAGDRLAKVEDFLHAIASIRSAKTEVGHG